MSVAETPTPASLLVLFSASAGRGETGFRSAKNSRNVTTETILAERGFPSPLAIFLEPQRRRALGVAERALALPSAGQADSLSGNRKTEVSQQPSALLSVFGQGNACRSGETLAFSVPTLAGLWTGSWRDQALLGGAAKSVPGGESFCPIFLDVCAARERRTRKEWGP